MMYVEKTNTGLIIHGATDEIKEKCLQYFSLLDPIREYFVYSGNDLKKKPLFGKEYDVIYISSGFKSINDEVIKKMHVFKTIQPATPKQIKIEMNREPRSDLQRDCIKMMTSSSSPKITVELKPGVGKTFISMYSASKLGLKPVIITPSTLLKNQWIENLEDCGIDKSDIATNIFDGPNKKCCVVTITSVENALRDDWEGVLKAFNDGQYGIKIIDEAHLHLKGMLKLDALCNIKYNWYLSATLGRSDTDEDKILNYALLDANRFVGDKKYTEYQKEYIRVYQQDIVYNPSQKLCNDTFKYGKKGLIKATYYKMLMEYKQGIPFMNNMVHMVKKVKALVKSDKKILLLVPLIEIIRQLMVRFQNDPYFKDMNVVMVDGSMPLSQKRKNLDEGNLILSTVQSMGVGVDVSDLIAVINFDQLASPISLEQIVGRLRDRGYDTVYVDICDHVKYARVISNWGKKRRELYPYFPGVYEEQHRWPTIYS